MNQNRLCLIHNPTAGRRSSRRRLEQLRQRFGEALEVRETTGPRVAGELARRAVEDGFSGVIAMGGDGTVHEVAVGLLDASATSSVDVPLIVCPVGSANDYAHSLLHEFGDTGRWPAIGAPVDVGRVHGLSPQPAWFINSLGLGFSARVTLESRRIRWLRGTLLYGLAALRVLTRHFECHEWTVALDGRPAEPHPVLMLSLLLGRREGNFLIAPNARMADGLFDYAIAGRLPGRYPFATVARVFRSTRRLSRIGHRPVSFPGNHRAGADRRPRGWRNPGAARRRSSHGAGGTASGPLASFRAVTESVRSDRRAGRSAVVKDATK